MPDKTNDLLRARLAELQAEEAALRARSAPIDAEIAKLQAGIEERREKMRALAEQKRAIERPRILELASEISAVSQALMGRRMGDAA